MGTFQHGRGGIGGTKIRRSMGSHGLTAKGPPPGLLRGRGVGTTMSGNDRRRPNGHPSHKRGGMVDLEGAKLGAEALGLQEVVHRFVVHLAARSRPRVGGGRGGWRYTN